MKKQTYKREIPFFVKIGIFLLMISSISIYFASQDLTSNIYIESTISGEITLSDSISPRASINHVPIFIDGDDGSNDWDTFPDKTGSGTYGDPYVIEDLEIFVGGSGSGIYIRDSEVHVVIRYCSISYYVNLEAGISLYNCKNIKIFNCTMNGLGNGGSGIFLNESSNINITGNRAEFSTDGISLYNADYNIFSNNTVINNEDNGIKLVDSHDNEIDNNNASFNLHGIYLEISAENIFSINNFQNNSLSSVVINGSSQNYWDNGIHGNCWGDLKDTYPDAINDGIIWNTYYEIDSINIDHYPLVFMGIFEEDPYNQQIDRPEDIKIFEGNLDVSILWTLEFNDYDNPYYIIFQDGIQVEMDYIAYNFVISYSLEDLPFGQYTFSIFAYDGLGDVSIDHVSVTILENKQLEYIILFFIGVMVIIACAITAILLQKKHRTTLDGKDNGAGNVAVVSDVGAENKVSAKRSYLSTREHAEVETQQVKPTSDVKLPITVKEEMETELNLVNRLIDEDLYTQAIISLKSMRTKIRYNKKLKSLNKKIVRRLDFAETTMHFQNSKDILWRDYKSQTNLQETYLKFKGIVDELNQIPHEAKIIKLAVVKEVFDAFEIIKRETKEKKTKEILEEIETIEPLLTPQGISEAKNRFLQMKSDYSKLELSEINSKIANLIKICEISIPINDEINAIWTRYQDQNKIVKGIKDFEDLDKKIELSKEKDFFHPSIVENLRNKEETLKKELSEHRANLEDKIEEAEKLLNPDSISEAVNIIKAQQKNADLYQFTDLFPRLSEIIGKMENIQKIFDVFKRTKRMSIADISKMVEMPRDELIKFVFDPAKGLQMLEIDGDYLILKEKKQKQQKKRDVSPSPTSTTFSGRQVKITRGGDWKIEGNLSIFHYKVKVLNKSRYVITQIQILLTGLPKGLEVEKDRYIIDSLKPKAFESPTFKFRASDSCVGDFIEGIVIYNSPTGHQITSNIEPFEICYVCNLLVPKQVSQQEFDQKTEFMKESRLTIESDLEFSDLERKIEGIIHNCNFALLQKLNQNQSDKYKKFEAFAEGLYDKQDVGLSVAVKKMESGSKLVIKAMSDRTDKITDLLRDFNVQLDEIKSDTELIKEYTSQIENLFDQVEDLEFFLKDRLLTDFERIRGAWDAYKNGEINRKELIGEGIRVIGKKFIRIIVDKASLLL
ncbi:MAG: NosD domain-containing protein [Promethearchaeota archaeon]